MLLFHVECVRCWAVLLCYVDLDECALNIGLCPYDQECYNTEGSYICRRIRTPPRTTECPTGHIYDSASNSCEGTDLSVSGYICCYLRSDLYDKRVIY